MLVRDDLLIPPVEKLFVVALSDGPRCDFKIVDHSVVELTVVEVNIDLAPCI
jgi:hypothetical protein